MKMPRQLGVIVEGNFTKSTVLRYPGLAEYIGPIKASALSVGQRVSGFIQAGTAIDAYEQLDGCDLVLIKVPDTSVSRIMDELRASSLKLAGMAFALCESWLPSEFLAPLSNSGATVATVLPVPAISGQWFALEGQYAAVKRAKRLLNNLLANTVELKPGSKYLYFATSAFVETLPRALFAAAQRSLRAAGLTGNHKIAVLEQMAQSMLRDITRGARAGWTGPLLDCPEDIAAGYLVHLEKTMPDLAELLAAQLKLAEPFIVERIQRRAKSGSYSRSRANKS